MTATLPDIDPTPDQLADMEADLAAYHLTGEITDSTAVLLDDLILDGLLDGRIVRGVASSHDVTTAHVRRVGEAHGLTYTTINNPMKDPALWPEGQPRTSVFRFGDVSLIADVLARYGEPEDYEWRDEALCAQTDPEAFFPEKGGSTREAKRVCRDCRVRAECLEYAIDNDERFGIWGGLSERERRRLRRQAVTQ